MSNIMSNGITEYLGVPLTPNHNVLTKDGWKEVRDIKDPNDCVTISQETGEKEVHRIYVSGCQHCSFCHWDERDSEYNPYCSLHNRLHNPKLETEKQLTLEGFAGSDLSHGLAMPSGCPLLEHTVVVRRNNYSKVIT